MVSQSQKRFKTEHTSVMLRRSSSSATLVNDENKPPKTTVPRSLKSQNRQPLYNPQMARRIANLAYQAENVDAGTGELLYSTIKRLRASMDSLIKDREALRVRWDADRRLQLVYITDHLTTVNEHFFIAEEALRYSVEVLERQIMGLV
ncbi:MAG: hypothetical protein Q9220_005824 [cf. Caloplaca sp. 1 TL-2023]